MNVKLCIFVLVLVLGVSSIPNRERRQAATTTTTPSPQYTGCLNSCRTTLEYNPVCGTDGVTYSNEGRLNCAVRCGSNIKKAFGGACEPVGR